MSVHNCLLLEMRYLMLLLVIGLHSNPAWAQSELCPPYSRTIRLAFDTIFVPVSYNHLLTIDEIRQLYRQGKEQLNRSHSNAIGITYAEIGMSFAASTRSLPLQGGGYCIYLDEVKATFGFDKFEVYIAQEYKKGSCEYRTILDHENEHVAINNDVIKNYGARIRLSLEEQLSIMPPTFVVLSDLGVDRAIQELHRRIEPTIQAFITEQRRRNSIIDTDANYGALQNLCENWMSTEEF
ncbi:MAG: hypothetical protein ACJZ9F_10800 [Rhodospirillaceae bacterium]